MRVDTAPQNAEGTCRAAADTLEARNGLCARTAITMWFVPVCVCLRFLVPLFLPFASVSLSPYLFGGGDSGTRPCSTSSLPKSAKHCQPQLTDLQFLKESHLSQRSRSHLLPRHTMKTSQSNKKHKKTKYSHQITN